MSKFIVSKTPLRVSFNGGGTDIESFYSKESGFVLSSTIDKFIYVTVKQHGDLFNEKIRLNYSDTEVVSEFDEIQNNIARECLKLLNVPKSIYISTISDIPSQSGLGSSSTFAVGLLNALNVYQGNTLTKKELAEQASIIEIDKLGHPIGKQDQYAASIGGLNIFKFEKNGNVNIEELKNKKNIQELFENSLFFWTGVRRTSLSVLTDQKENTLENFENLKLIKELAIHSSKLFRGNFDLNLFGKNLDRSWSLKRKLSKKISNQEFNELYEASKKQGALGGKILGAGGGGFLFIVAKKINHDDIRKVFCDYEEIRFKFENSGSEIIYSCD